MLASQLLQMCSEWEEREKHLYYIYYNIIIQTNKVRRQYKQTSNNNWMSECLYFGQICLKLRTATWYNMTDRQGFPVMVTEDENVWCSTLWSLSAHDPEHSQSICTHKYNMFVRRLFFYDLVYCTSWAESMINDIQSTVTCIFHWTQSVYLIENTLGRVNTAAKNYAL